MAVLAVLVALEIYGFRASRVFAQEIWSPEGGVRAVRLRRYMPARPIVLILAPWRTARRLVLVGLTTVFLGSVLAVALPARWSRSQLVRLKAAPMVRHLLALLGAAVHLPHALAARL